MALALELTAVVKRFGPLLAVDELSFSVESGEFVSVLFDLASGKNYLDVLNSLNGAVLDAQGAPALRVGIHVQAFGDGSSASFINAATPSAVPLPSAAWLMVAGLAVLGRRRRSAEAKSPPN